MEDREVRHSTFSYDLFADHELTAWFNWCFDYQRIMILGTGLYHQGIPINKYLSIQNESNVVRLQPLGGLGPTCIASRK